MHLLTTVDPRDNLEKATRKELEIFAKENGVKEIVSGMPANLMRRILRARGLTRIKIPNRVLGQPYGRHDEPAPVEGSSIEVSADEDLMRQWIAQQQTPAPETPKAETPVRIGDLRRELKRRGIPQKNTDRKKDLMAKLEAS